ncbi:MAG: FGGY-family carbohydrate kinase [Acidimicrobiaceae bacterium]|nr:FGGY-family carbohydrate kinase [Acidimicrobiaceae bacterium]
MSSVVVGVDLGTGGARAVALARDGGVRLWVYEPFDGADSWPAGRADPAAWLNGLGRLLARVNDSGLEIAAVGIGGQSPTTVPITGSGGTVVAGLAATCRHPAGNGLDRTGHHLAQLDFLRHELGQPVAGGQIWDWALRCLGAGDVQGLWPGEEPIPGYGEHVEVGTVIGHCDGSLGLSEGTPLVSASNDAYMSFWAGGLCTPRRGHDPGGRTGGLGVAVDAAQRPADIPGYFSPVAGVEVVGGPTNGHGQLLEWWSTTSGRSIEDLLTLAERVAPGAGGLLVLPYHDGERAPRWESRLRGEIHGLTFDTGVAEIARAVLEAAGYGLRHVHEELQAAGVAMDVMCCAGSPALSRLWCSIKASVLEVPVEVPDRPDQLSAHGCALCAGAALDWWDGVGAERMDSWPLARMTRIEPSPDEAYRAGYERFVALGDAAVARLPEVERSEAVARAARERSEQERG